MTTTGSDLRRKIDTGQQTTFITLSDLSDRTTLIESLVALANTRGGMLVAGVDDTAICGIDDERSAISRLIDAALSTEPPLIVPLPRAITLDDKSLLVMDIPAGLPHVYAYDGRYLQRDGTTNTPMTPSQLRRLMLARGEMHFETHIPPGATLDAIDWDKAGAYARTLSGFSDAEDDTRQVLLKRGCLVQQDDTLYPTNAGILLFGNDPQQYLIGSDISAVRFAGDGMGDTFSRQDVTGTLPDQITRAETFLIDHLRKEVTLKHTMKREELYEFPMEAARELVINAVAHRDYSIRGDNIRLLIFSNRMEVHSPGVLPGHMTLSNLKEERFSRNPIIVQVLADMNYIEKLGYGVDRVLELMRSQNLQAPAFEEGTGSFQVILHNAAVKPLALPAEQPSAESNTGADITAHDAVAAKPDQPETEIETEISTTPTFALVNGKYKGHEINHRQEGALQYLHDDDHSRITNSDLKALFPDVHPETIRRDLVDLVEKDILLKMGQKRGSYYVLKQDTPENQEAD